jgi:hypothetical protein
VQSSQGCQAQGTPPGESQGAPLDPEARRQLVDFYLRKKQQQVDWFANQRLVRVEYWQSHPIAAVDSDIALVDIQYLIYAFWSSSDKPKARSYLQMRADIFHKTGGLDLSEPRIRTATLALAAMGRIKLLGRGESLHTSSRPKAHTVQVLVPLPHVYTPRSTLYSPYQGVLSTTQDQSTEEFCRRMRQVWGPWKVVWDEYLPQQDPGSPRTPDPLVPVPVGSEVEGGNRLHFLLNLDTGELRHAQPHNDLYAWQHRRKFWLRILTEDVREKVARKLAGGCSLLRGWSLSSEAGVPSGARVAA